MFLKELLMLLVMPLLGVRVVVYTLYMSSVTGDWDQQ